MDIKLKVNNKTINLGSKLNIKDLELTGFRRLGFFGRMRLRPFKKEVVYWSKNPLILCFDNEYKVEPVLDIKQGSDLMFGTTVYLFFVNNELNKVGFQVIGNDLIAKVNFMQFCHFMEQDTGISAEDGGIGVLQWKDSESCLISQLNQSDGNFVVYWFIIHKK